MAAQTATIHATVAAAAAEIVARMGIHKRKRERERLPSSLAAVVRSPKKKQQAEMHFALCEMSDEMTVQRSR